MKRQLRLESLCLALALLGWGAPAVFAQPADSLIAVSADIVEISGSVEHNVGFSWGPFQTGINFAEKSIPGIYHVGDFARQTALQTSLKLLETEGKAQLLSNPKVIVQAGSQANFTVGGLQPYPVCNNQGCSAELKKIATVLNIVPVINPNKKDTIRAEFQLEVSNPDFSKPVQIGGTSVPSVITRQIQTSVELKSGETLVIGGLKSSNKNVTISRVPFLGHIPIIGLLFTTKDIVEQQSSLFLFITMEIIK
ncbi:MAG: type II and III secretion system protein [Elusimicrobia bacterium]|nr:type II and III secretion system protein [Elusimicrobiota bacterium]MDE2236378.1 type II and III secretion system protein [Elusimicrobiota bacterium]MDE2426209.1 type II and III secretion system protein [Elusimicrobiota bacterium]